MNTPPVPEKELPLPQDDGKKYNHRDDDLQGDESIFAKRQAQSSEDQGRAEHE